MHFEFLKLPDAASDVPELKEAFARLRKYFKENITEVMLHHQRAFVAAFEFSEEAKDKAEDLQRILAMWIRRLLMDPNTKLPGVGYDSEDSLPGARYSAILLKGQDVFLNVFPKTIPTLVDGVRILHVEFASINARVVE